MQLLFHAQQFSNNWLKNKTYFQYLKYAATPITAIHEKQKSNT